MAALKMSRTPSLGGSRALSQTQGILIETMQLVEPKKHLPVPNHLLESKIYSKLAVNDVIQARPAVVHFAGFELGRTHRQSLKLGNVSTELQRMHVIPPQTKYFYIKYTKNERLVPGMSLDCIIEFTPDEHRYYYDCVRVHCKGEENLVIPIHAYPVMDLSDFPSHLTFPPVPVGQRTTRVIPLSCNAPVDFEFQLTYIQPHPSFSVQPMMGVIPANQSVDITVAFMPSEFITAQMQIQLVISQFNSRPLICSVSGSSTPGLAKKESETQLKQVGMAPTLDPRSITPVDRARKKKKSRQKDSEQPKNGKGFVQNGIHFPENLDTPHGVAQVLLQEPGKLSMKALREEMSKKGASAGKTRQLKEAVFEMAVRQDVYEERQNQLRWQVKIGDDQVTSQKRMDVFQDREISLREYKVMRGDPVEEQEYNRNCTSCTFRRTVRDVGQLGQDGIKFDTYSNDMWAVRHDALSRFQQAARKIIIRRRANKKIRGLRETILAWGDRRGRHSSLSQRGAQTPTSQSGQEESDSTGLILAVDRVKSVTFPVYSNPEVKDDMAVDALGPVPVVPTEIVLQKKVPFMNLVVPQNYKLMGYQPHNVHDASSGYVPPTPVRPLRTGAEDEIITLAPQATVVKEEAELVNEGDMHVEDYVTTPVPSAQEAVTLKPPQALFRPVEYPPLHIFNPAPGLQTFLSPLPYAEVDPDFHLCPLPRYTGSDASNPHMSTQKQYLDREDVIKGVMTWKRFPSQGLTSLANTPTLTNVWVPRWDDPFNSNLLPHDVPPQLDGLPQADLDNIQEEQESGESGETGLELTPEMVKAQFSLVDDSSPPQEDSKTKKEEVFPHGNKLPSTNIPVSSNGPVPREKRERELEFFLKKKYNRLGNKFKSRTTTSDNLTTNPDLVLK